MLKKVIREKDKEKLDMNVFKELGKDLNYKDILQVDGAFSACHINYGKSLKFNGADSKNMAQNSRKNPESLFFNIFTVTDLEIIPLPREHLLTLSVHKPVIQQCDHTSVLIGPDNSSCGL